ncbi:hypothetical protein VNI00_017559 [Paramarasmius palmivorus]|uniref:BTB domain-containing protein n=1 Tax=Paramarasmius palmivorus TaxID=297713 RepID=A0AAW0B4U1_9AGAR
MSASLPANSGDNSSAAPDSDASSGSSFWMTMGDVADLERISAEVLESLPPRQFDAVKDLMAKINIFGAYRVVSQLNVTDLDDWDVPIAEFTTKAQRETLMMDRRRWRCDRCGAINRGTITDEVASAEYKGLLDCVVWLMDEVPMLDITNNSFYRRQSQPGFRASIASYDQHSGEMMDGGRIEPLAVAPPQLPRFHYRRGREWEFQILVNGEDCEYEVPASLLSVVSRYFSGIARGATRGGDGDFDYVQVNVLRYNREVVGTVLELVYRLDDPSSVFNRFAAMSRTGDDLVRSGVCSHLMDVLCLANEWTIARLKRSLQDALVRDFDVIVSLRDLRFVYDVSKRVKAGILGRECEVVMQRLGMAIE